VYRAVLVPFDGSERSLVAVPWAEVLAGAWACEVEVLHVDVADDGDLVPEVGGHLVRHVDGRDPAATLIAEVHLTAPDDLLCMSTHGRTAVGELLLGSVTGTVLHDLHSELVLVGPKVDPSGAAVRPRRALVCLDGSAVSASILPVARQWAEGLDLEVVLLHVTYPLGAPGAVQVDLPEEVDVIVEDLAGIAADWKDGGVAAQWSLAESEHAATGILEQAVARGADLILMATHGRTGLERVLMGSVTKAVVRQASVPVVTLRPPGLT
jgi:nucleotide-binding universal stress UspA family protein